MSTRYFEDGAKVGNCCYGWGKSWRDPAWGKGCCGNAAKVCNNWGNNWGNNNWGCCRTRPSCRPCGKNACCDNACLINRGRNWSCEQYLPSSPADQLNYELGYNVDLRSGQFYYDKYARPPTGAYSPWT